MNEVGNIHKVVYSSYNVPEGRGVLLQQKGSVCCTGIHGPIAYSLLGGGIPILEQRLCGTLYSVPINLVYYFRVKRCF